MRGGGERKRRRRVMSGEGKRKERERDGGGGHIREWRNLRGRKHLERIDTEKRGKRYS